MWVVSRHDTMAPRVLRGSRRGRLRSRPGRRRLWARFPSGFSRLCFSSVPRASMQLCKYCTDSLKILRVVSRHDIMAPRVPRGSRRGRLRSRPGRIRHFPIVSVERSYFMYSSSLTNRNFHEPLGTQGARTPMPETTHKILRESVQYSQSYSDARGAGQKQ